MEHFTFLVEHHKLQGESFSKFTITLKSIITRTLVCFYRLTLSSIEKVEIDKLLLNGNQSDKPISYIWGQLKDPVSSPGLFIFDGNIYILGGYDSQQVCKKSV